MHFPSVRLVGNSETTLESDCPLRLLTGAVVIQKPALQVARNLLQLGFTVSRNMRSPSKLAESYFRPTICTVSRIDFAKN